MVKVVLLLSSHGKMGDLDRDTGWFLPEAAHPYYVFADAGYEITVASPKGGDAPLDPKSFEEYYVETDPKSKEFFDKFCAKKSDNKLYFLNTVPLESLKGKGNEYDAVVCAGGHGPMWDFTGDDVNDLVRDCYENGGIAAAVCHGPAGIVNTKLSNGEYLVKGKTVTCFTNAEEEAIGLTKAMPFLLESVLKEHGANFQTAANWKENVCSDNRVVTGQNPASAEGMGKKIVEVLGKK